MRAFLALNLPKKERTRIQRSARPLVERELPVLWSEIEDYHVTLKFLGDIRGERVDQVKGVMEKVADSTAPFVAKFAGFGAFPTIRLPEVLWIGVEASPELRCLKQDLEWGLAEHAFDRETRAFHPHITLGRSTEAADAGSFRGLDDVVAELAHEGDFTVRSIDLMQSVRGKAGPKFTVVDSIRLTGAP